jgi:anaerobic selenocysteine-containing dehydrogenase
MPTVRSFCRVCTSVCGILVDIDGDRVVTVHGDGEHPFSHGYTCPKGRALPQIHHHPHRLEHPQMRVDGTLQDTTWDECLEDLGTKLRDTIDKDGPESVGINFGTGVGMDASAIGSRSRCTPRSALRRSSAP